MKAQPQLKPDEFSVTVICDSLHPDDIEEVQRSLAESHYDFKVDVVHKTRVESDPGLLFIGIHTKLVVRFSAKWFYGRTRQGGVKAVVKAIDDVLARSPHDRDLRPTPSFDSNGQGSVTIEEWLRPLAKKRSWSRGDILTAVGLPLLVISTIAASIVVPEVRRLLHLDPQQTIEPVKKPAATPTVQPPAATPQNTEPRKPEVPKPKKGRLTQKSKTYVTGNGNVAGNNVSGDNNVTGNNNAVPTAVAPNGIAISGGTVTNPTVNNVTALPDLTMSDAQEQQVSDLLGQTFAGLDVSIIVVQANQNTRDFSDRLIRILKSSGANVEVSTAWMYVPPSGVDLHKGLSVISFPSEQKDTVGRFAEALGTAKVIQVLPIYNVKDNKVNIIVNRSSETPGEARRN
jgi:hypothetical protein